MTTDQHTQKYFEIFLLDTPGGRHDEVVGCTLEGVDFDCLTCPVLGFFCDC